jgi:hypothetical protein
VIRDDPISISSPYCRSLTILVQVQDRSTRIYVFSILVSSTSLYRSNPSIRRRLHHEARIPSIDAQCLRQRGRKFNGCTEYKKKVTLVSMKPCRALLNAWAPLSSAWIPVNQQSQQPCSHQGRQPSSICSTSHLTLALPRVRAYKESKYQFQNGLHFCAVELSMSENASGSDNS